MRPSCCLQTRSMWPWASADFFPNEGKNFPGGGGQKPIFCLKNNKKILFFPKKSKNILFLAALGRQRGGQEPPLPSPADAHVCGLNDAQNKQKQNWKISSFLSYLQTHEWLSVTCYVASVAWKGPRRYLCPRPLAKIFASISIGNFNMRRTVKLWSRL